MALKVRLSTSATLIACFRVINAAFPHGAPFVDLFFPERDTPEGQAKGVDRLRKLHEGNQHAKLLEATDRAGNVIGFAIWILMLEPPSPDLDKETDVKAVWGDRVDDIAFARRVWSEFVRPRGQVARTSGSGGTYVLDLLAVHPEAQKQGVGEILVRWGTKAADERQARAIVESTAVARKLYEKCGFRVKIERMQFDVGAEFKGRKIPHLTFMQREIGVDGLLDQ